MVTLLRVHLALPESGALARSWRYWAFLILSLGMWPRSARNAQDQCGTRPRRATSYQSAGAGIRRS
eukprot:351389-Chlamydomonas_euryale.AAC.2